LATFCPQVLCDRVIQQNANFGGLEERVRGARGCGAVKLLAALASRPLKEC
jgi:hypothetical protein